MMLLCGNIPRTGADCWNRLQWVWSLWRPSVRCQTSSSRRSQGAAGHTCACCRNSCTAGCRLGKALTLKRHMGPVYHLSLV